MAQTKKVAIALEIDLPYPHHQQVYLGVRRYASEHPQWECVLDEHPGYAMNRRRYVTRYDGVIARVTKGLETRCKRMGVPLVSVMHPKENQRVGAVASDARMMGRLLAEHLIERGFPKLIAGFVDPSRRHAWLVAQAFKARAEEEDIECRLMDFAGGVYNDARSWMRMQAHIHDILNSVQPPTGLFVEEAQDARLIVQYANKHGLTVPHDLAIVCQHNIDSIVNAPPQITSIDSNYERVGYEAAALLDRMMDGEPMPDEPVLVPPRGVVGRETTDYFAVEDELVGDALRYISTRLNQKLRVEDIAYALNVSTRLLQIRFDKALGVGVSDEIRRLRLEKAKRLLMEPDRQIGSIPNEVGFATLYTMNQVFHRELGMPPSAYRKQVLGED